MVECGPNRSVAPAFAANLRRTLFFLCVSTSVLFAVGSRQLLKVHAREAAAAQARLVAAALIPGPNGDLSESVARVRDQFPRLIAVGTLRVQGGLHRVYPDRSAHRDAILAVLNGEQSPSYGTNAVHTVTSVAISSPWDGQPIRAVGVVLPLNGSLSPAAQRAVVLFRRTTHVSGWFEATSAFTLLAAGLAFISYRSQRRWFEREVSKPLRTIARAFAQAENPMEGAVVVEPRGWRETTQIAGQFEELVWRSAQAAARAQNVEREGKRRLREREVRFDRRLRRAEERALVDPLTRLHNRAFLEQRLEELFTQQSTQGADLSIVMIDVDNFKQYNDNHGHQVGDTLLTFVGTLLKGSIRSADCAVRYGGDEFLLLLPDTDSRQAGVTAERIIKLFAQYARRLEPNGVLSISAGVASMAMFQCKTGQELLTQADRALYAAKHAGKNRVGMQPEAAARRRTHRLPSNPAA